MALQLETYLSGKMHNVVFFKRAGTYMARSLPATVKMAAASKICSGNFGVASAAGKSLRQLLLPVLPFPKDRRMQVRFSGAIARWLGAADRAVLPPTTAVPYIDGFRFNNISSISERWKLPLTVEQPADGMIQVHIPAFIPTQAISAPAHCVAVDIVFTAAGCLLSTAAATSSHTVTLTIAYTNDPVSTTLVDLPLPTPAGSLVITAAALRYRMASGQLCTQPSFLPASVIDARYI